MATAAKLPIPVLVLQGERDYQVTMDALRRVEERSRWPKKDATLKSYPALNHLFLKGVGKSNPGEYSKANHVAKEVVDDIAAWIRSKGKP